MLKAPMQRLPTRARHLAPVPRTPRLVTCRAQGDVSRQLTQIGQELDAILANLSTPGSQPADNKTETMVIGDAEYLCDENGCVLLSRNSGQQPAGSPSGQLDKTLLTGSGWRLGTDTSSEAAAPFNAVVGGNTWTVSLTQAELSDFVLALQAIRSTIRQMSQQEPSPVPVEDSVGDASGAAKGPLKVKWDTATVRMEAELGEAGPSEDDFNLSFTIGAGRAVRAKWTADVVKDMLKVLDEKVAGFVNKEDPHAPAAQTPLQAESRKKSVTATK